MTLALLELGIAERMSDTVREQVIDVGSRWRFRFEYLGQDVGEVSVNRSQLVRDSWRIVIPEDIGRRLEGAGVRPSAD